MAGVHELLKTIGVGIIYVASDPIFLLTALLILYMYKREAYKIQNDNYLKKVSYTAVKDIVRGALIGIIVSSILTTAGISIPVDKGFILLIPIALLLMFINPKLGCFSYVVPLTYLIHCLLIVSKGSDRLFFMHYKELLFLVGTLHILEGILVGLYGHENALTMPIYENKRIVRAQFLKKFWVVPLLIFTTEGTKLMGIPIYAILCYSDICTYQLVMRKKQTMGVLLLIYGLLILGIAYGVTQGKIPLGMAMLMMPFFHESIFIIDQRVEKFIYALRTGEIK